MARFEISITGDYVPTWGYQEAARELLQNAMDEQDRDPTHPMDVRYSSRGGGHLTITSHGVVLDRAVLLLGTSGKRATPARGKFGEGLDLALLAAVRAGHAVRIENGAESWSPALEHSATWGAMVLTVQTHVLAQPRQHFRVEVLGVSPDAWLETVRRTLFLPGAIPASETVIPGIGGRILLDRSGDIYVRGLWVGKFVGYQCGFDLDELELDRDRRMANAYMLGILVAKVLAGALGDPTHRDAALSKVSGLLATGSADVAHLGWALQTTYGEAGVAARKALADSFHAKWGERAVPVLTTTEADQAAAVGLVPVPVERTAKETLEVAIGTTFDAAVIAAGRARIRVLTPAEITALTWAPRWAFVKKLAADMGIEAPISIAETADATTWGIWRIATKDIVLSTKCLAQATPGQAIVTLAHEWGHARLAALGHAGDHAAVAEDVLAQFLGRVVVWPC